MHISLGNDYCRADMLKIVENYNSVKKLVVGNVYWINSGGMWIPCQYEGRCHFGGPTYRKEYVWFKTPGFHHNIFIKRENIPSTIKDTDYIREEKINKELIFKYAHMLIDGCVKKEHFCMNEYYSLRYDEDEKIFKKTKEDHNIASTAYLLGVHKDMGFKDVEFANKKLFSTSDRHFRGEQYLRKVFGIPYSDYESFCKTIIEIGNVPYVVGQILISEYID